MDAISRLPPAVTIEGSDPQEPRPTREVVWIAIIDSMGRAEFLAVFTALSAASCTAPMDTAETERGVVYDVDDRTDVFAHGNATYRELAERSIVALIRSSRIDDANPNDVRLDQETLGEKEDLCMGERFRDQPAVASCSGTLIDNDLVLTAGHCVNTVAKCEARRFVFDYFYSADGVAETITTADVFSCRRRVVYLDDNDVDYAVVQLDRPVQSSRAPVSIRAPDEIMLDGTPLLVVGFPNGLPAKIDDGGEVLRSHRVDRFEASLDTFDSNSGSGVFDHGGTMVGVLNSGKRDYVTDGDCNRVNVLRAVDVNGDAEESTYVARAVEGLCATDWATDVCGDTAGWCRPCAEDTQCPSGWVCQSAGHDPGVTWCAAPCGDDSDCSAGHSCNGTRCTPNLDSVCVGQTVYLKNSCGRRVAREQVCDAPRRVCQAGACVDPAAGNACGNAIQVDMVDATLTGTFDERITHTTRGTCGGAGREVILELDITARVDLQADATGFDTILHLRTDCGDEDSEVACVDDSDPPGDRGSRLEASLTPGKWFLVLDAYSSAEGDWTLDLRFTGGPPPPVDAGFPADAGEVQSDAGPPIDAGNAAPDAAPAGRRTQKKSEDGDDGCGCSGTRSTGYAWGWLLLPAVWLRRRTCSF